MRPSASLVVIAALAAGCVKQPLEPTATVESATARDTAAPALRGLWIGPAVPDELRNIATRWGLAAASDAGTAAVKLDISANEAARAGGTSVWVYALVAPFPTVLDGVSLAQLRAAWTGASSETFSRWPLWMSDSTLRAISALWGAPALQVHAGAGDQLLDSGWSQRPSWAIIPFELIEPRWKVLTVDGQSPIRKDFDLAAYPLKVTFAVSANATNAASLSLPPTNRDPAKMTTVIMTGTSGLVREIAYQMEIHGIDYPGRDIGDWLRQADILHVSHEISFDPACPPPNPYENRFYCGDPKYIGLFDTVGVDVIELTGNHMMDNGTASMLFTLDLYHAHHMQYFGGGANLAEARTPLLMQDHGNKIAFVGCNAAEPPQPLAQPNLPGANPCDWKQFSGQIRDLRRQGYLPIVTFQYKEGYSPMVMPWQSLDFRRAADAGAAIVSGSQSHVPLEMEFYKGTFIHYGLGNLFFGQMANQPPGPGLPLQPAERYEFLDRHVFYDGRYISTELLTAMLEDYARPRPMTPDERAALLQAYFGYSDWLPLIPTPAPKKTPTLYPFLTFSALPTHTPLPSPHRAP